MSDAGHSSSDAPAAPPLQSPPSRTSIRTTDDALQSQHSATSSAATTPRPASHSQPLRAPLTPQQQQQQQQSASLVGQASQPTQQPSTSLGLQLTSHGSSGGVLRVVALAPPSSALSGIARVASNSGGRRSASTAAAGSESEGHGGGVDSAHVQHTPRSLAAVSLDGDADATDHDADDDFEPRRSGLTNSGAATSGPAAAATGAASAAAASGASTGGGSAAGSATGSRPGSGVWSGLRISQRGARRRRGSDGDTVPLFDEEARRDDRSQKIIGIACSGGGIRSAAFSAGVIHDMAHSPDWDAVQFISCVSGGGYAGGSFADWALHESPAPPRTWVSRWAAHMRANSAFICSCVCPSAAPDIALSLLVFLLLVVLLILSHAPFGMILTYALYQLIGDTMTNVFHPGYVTMETLLLYMFVALLVFNIVRPVLAGVCGAACGTSRAVMFVYVLRLIRYTYVAIFLLLATFWLQRQLEGTVASEYVTLGVVITVAATVLVPWVLSRVFAVQAGLLVLVAIYSRFLLWRVTANYDLFYVIPYSDANFTGIVASSIVLQLLSAWLTPWKNSLVAQYYRWRLQRAFFHPRSRGRGGCRGMCAALVGCSCVYSACNVSRGTTLGDLQHQRPQYIASATSQLWSRTYSDPHYDVFEMANDHCGRVVDAPGVTMLRTASHPLSEIMAASGAVLAVNNGSYRETRDVTTVLAGSGLSLGRWLRTKPASVSLFVISQLLYVFEAALLFSALFIVQLTSRVLIVTAFASRFTFLVMSFFVDELSYNPVVRSVKNALQVVSYSETPPQHIYVSDGAHYENVGLMPLLRRECDVILVCDVGADPSYEFDDVLSVVNIARRKMDISFRPVGGEALDLETALLKEFAKAGKMHVHVKLRYKSGREGDLFVLKPLLPSRVADPVPLTPFDAAAAKRGPELHGCCCEDCHKPKCRWLAALSGRFPHHLTANQFFTQSQWDAYFALGRMAYRDAFGVPDALADESTAAAVATTANASPDVGRGAGGGAGGNASSSPANVDTEAGGAGGAEPAGEPTVWSEEALRHMGSVD